METNSRTGIENRLKVLSKRRGWLFEYAARWRKVRYDEYGHTHVQYVNPDIRINKALELMRGTIEEIYRLMERLHKVGPIKRRN